MNQRPFPLSPLARLPGVIDESKRLAEIRDDVTRPSRSGRRRRLPARTVRNENRRRSSGDSTADVRDAAPRKDAAAVHRTSSSQSHSADRLASALEHVSADKSDFAGRCAKATSVPHVCLESGRSKRPDIKCAVFALEGCHNSVEPIQHLEGHAHAVVRGCRALDHDAFAIEATFIAAPAGLRCAELLRKRTRRLSPHLSAARAAGSILPRLHNHSGSPSCARISI